MGKASVESSSTGGVLSATSTTGGAASASATGAASASAGVYGPPAEIETSTGNIYAVADGETHSLDPKYIPLQRVSRSIGGSILSLAAFIVVLIVSLVNGFSWVRAAIGFGIWGFLTTLLSIWVFHWPTVRYRHMSYQVDRKGFRFREGVYWQSAVSVPKTRIQHTDVSQGPIERQFGLSTLIVHTAGTEHASVSLDGLRHETSLKIRDFLLAPDEEEGPAGNGSTEEGSTGGGPIEATFTDGAEPTGAASAEKHSVEVESADMGSAAFGTAEANTSGADKAGADKAGADTTGPDTTGADKAGADTTGADPARASDEASAPGSRPSSRENLTPRDPHATGEDDGR